MEIAVPISVVIRTKNSSSTIGNCLQSLTRQTVTQDIIIVDSGSTDDTLDIVYRYPCRILHYPKTEVFNYSAALNMGIAAATYPCVLLLSSHVELQHEQSLEWMQHFLLTDEVVKSVSLSRSARRMVGEELVTFEQVDWYTVDISNFRGQGMFNYCAMIRKSDWEVQAFDVTMPACEDQAWINHFIQTQNAKAVIIRYPYVHYDNPYYNLSKDIRDHLVIAQRVHPYQGSAAFIKQKYRIAWRYLRNRNWQRARHEFLLGFHLTRNKIAPIDISRYASVYNKKLK
ncbi:MAG: glycosyltransferase family A protein [Bacteroidota bacterium]